MGLLEDLEEAREYVNRQSRYCSVCNLLSDLPMKEMEALAKFLADEKIPHTVLSKVLRKNGYHISDKVLGRHRRQECTGVAGR